MIVFVKFNSSDGFPVELAESASVAELKAAVGQECGVLPHHLRVIFAGRELHNDCTLQSYDLPEQSTVHVVLPTSGPARRREVFLQSQLRGTADSLTRLDLSETRLPSASTGLASILGTENGGESGSAPFAESRPHCSFYVFCKSPCGAIRPGKLRVRCRTCLQGTLTLSRGPSCWDDVLLPNRIHGVCQSQDCDGRMAEFYLKCAMHPTAADDTSVALDLITPNVRGIPCIACTDILSPVLVSPCPDRHVICLDCFHIYCVTRLNERQFVHHPEVGYSLPCPAGCPDSLIKEVHHFRVLGEEQFVFCRECKDGFHEGECQTRHPAEAGVALQGYIVDEDAAQRARWERASRKTIEETTRPCPRCRVPVEKSGGCMHMVCPRAHCKFEWCWLCQVEWNRECMGSHWFG
ncbi:E3 ubiquitin-protein ligase parkin isoform X3 [Brienomyrus brachyistius]|uniref:E3 ubiquitin-protein ligase parkin isoform X3 n=1 Tax=Brienomyrus brachyistius TaxID=42636 RepID=UPI0020B23F9E|nr:E3 ubiquitin-protein ligase parkin isoform X3 [Brienomyrus brachyistius]